MNKATNTKLNHKTIIFIVVAALLVAVIITSAILLIIDAVNDKKESNFDYLTSDLSDYVYISKSDYTDYKLSIDYADPHDIDVDILFLQLLSSDRGALVDNGVYSNKYTVYPGDSVQIWYSGYIYDEDGNPLYVDGMSNIADEDPYTLTIGSGTFIPGFELGLVGKCAKDYTALTKIVGGEVKEEYVVYVNYTRLVEGGSDSNKVTKTNVRIDLSDPDVDATYGEGFKAALLNAGTVGSTEAMEFSVTLDGKTYNYTNTKISFATLCEGGDDVIKVDCYFPYDYGTDGYSSANLRNEKATFEVYIKYVQHYELAEGVEWDDENKTYVITDEYIESQLGVDTITREELDEYEGDTLVEKYRSYLLWRIDEAYAEEYEDIVEAAIWKQLKSKAKIKKYPTAKVKEIYDEYIDDVYLQFENSGGTVTNSYTGESTTYDKIDEYAVAYLGLTYAGTTDWKGHLYSLSEDLVAERLILYYILSDLEGAKPTEAELNATRESIKAEYIEEYIAQYLEYEGKKKSDFTDEEYAAYAAEREAEILDYYDDEHFTETAYYDVVLKKLMTYPEISTLNDRRAYPLDK